MSSLVTPEVKDLQDVLIVFSGLYFLLSAIQIAADRARVRYPPDTLKMVTNIILGIFLIAFYLTVAGKEGSINNTYPINNFLT